MDPYETELREQVERMNLERDSAAEEYKRRARYAEFAAQDLADYLAERDALDVWMQFGGFRPTGWER